MTTTDGGAVIFRTITDRDVDAAAGLITDSGRVIAGMRTPAAYRALCRDGASDQRVVILVAEGSGGLAGYGVCFIDWRRYRRSYALRHPAQAVRMIAERALAAVGAKRVSDARDETNLPPPPGVRPRGASGRSWSESSPKIAKIAEIFVTPERRGKGLGPSMLRALFAELARRGAERVDCRTDIRNAASLRMNEKVGLDMEMTGFNSLFGTRDIREADRHEGDDFDDHL